MSDNYKMHITELKEPPAGVILQDLPPTACFKDQYGNVMMRLANGVGSVVTSGKAPPDWDLDGCIYCVCLNDSPEIGRGGIARYSPSQMVVPLESRVTVSGKFFK